jgi:hypothetical protein
MSPAVTILVCVDAARAISAGPAPDNCGGVYSASPNFWKRTAGRDQSITSFNLAIEQIILLTRLLTSKVTRVFYATVLIAYI